jgi:hypothetical protein
LTTDILSEKINTLNSACQNSELWEDTTLRHEVILLLTNIPPSP